MQNQADYQYYYERAQAIMKEFVPAKKPKNLSKYGTFLFIVTLILISVGILGRVKILLIGSLVAFPLAIVFYVAGSLQGGNSSTERKRYDQFTNGVLIDRMMTEMCPGCTKSVGNEMELAVNSRLFGTSMESCESEGTYHVTTPRGIHTMISHIVTYGRNADKEVIRLESGTLIYYPRVLKTPVVEPVYVFYNENGYGEYMEQEIHSIAGKNSLARFYHSDANPLSTFFSNIMKGQFNKQSIPIPDEEFNNYYQAFSKDHSSGYFVLTKERVNQLKALHKELGEWVSVSYIGQDVYILLKAELNFTVGTAAEPKIREDMFGKFYRNVTMMDQMLYYTIG